MADVEVTNCGSVFLVTATSKAAKEWIEENVATEGWQRLGDGLAVEPRFAADLVVGMQADGLEVV